MANIKSQIKRNNRSERERFENRHYTSQIKTYFRRLETAVTAGDDAQITDEHRKLVSLIDKAVKRGALHANTGARKKSRAERMRRAPSAALAPASRRRRSLERGGVRSGSVGFCVDSGWMPAASFSSARITCITALISARCVNACGKLPEVAAAARVDLLRVQVQR